MLIRFFFKNIQSSKELKNFLQTKIKKIIENLHLTKNPEIEVAKEIGNKSGNIFRSEIMLHLPKSLVRVEEYGRSILESFDRLLPKLKIQIKKYREKKKSNNKKYE